MITEGDCTKKFPPWKSSIKASGIPLCWLVIVGHLEQTLYWQSIAESHPLLHFM